jgi:hypothetical protein
MSRQCDRPTCAQPAFATLTYNYADGTVWVDRLADDDHPMTYDLCDRHAAGLRVPRGWRLDDRRFAAAALAFSTQPAPHSGAECVEFDLEALGTGRST